MKFYFASVARIKSVDELSEEIDYPMFGTILHAAMQRLYTPIKGVINPAKQIGIADRVGSLEPGKDGDVVIWSADPLVNVGAHAVCTVIDGRIVHQEG